MTAVAHIIEPPNSVLLLVGREEFTPPESFGGRTCVATHDCVAIAVVSVDDAPTSLSLSPTPDTEALMRLGEFQVETEGQLSVRDVYNREYDTVGVAPGLSLVTVWGNDAVEPSEIAVQFAQEA